MTACVLNINLTGKPNNKVVIQHYLDVEHVKLNIDNTVHLRGVYQQDNKALLAIMKAFPLAVITTFDGINHLVTEWSPMAAKVTSVVVNYDNGTTEEFNHPEIDSNWHTAIAYLDSVGASRRSEQERYTHSK